jgi:aspartate/tyrosine/aromatic aminotransferase
VHALLQRSSVMMLLRQMWIDELEETRLSMLTLRQQLADELKAPDQLGPL